MKRPLPMMRTVSQKRILLVRLLDHPELIRNRVPLLRRQLRQRLGVNPQARHTNPLTPRTQPESQKEKGANPSRAHRTPASREMPTNGTLSRPNRRSRIRLRLRHDRPSRRQRLPLRLNTPQRPLHRPHDPTRPRHIPTRPIHQPKHLIRQPQIDIRHVPECTSLYGHHEELKMQKRTGRTPRKKDLVRALPPVCARACVPLCLELAGGDGLDRLWCAGVCERWLMVRCMWCCVRSHAAHNVLYRQCLRAIAPVIRTDAAARGRSVTQCQIYAPSVVVTDLAL